MSRETQRKRLHSSGALKNEGSSSVQGEGRSQREDAMASVTSSSLGEQDRFKLAVLENQLQLLQKRVGETANSDIKLNHLLAQQQRDREEWEESRRSLERQLAQERERRRSPMSQTGRGDDLSGVRGEWAWSNRSLQGSGRLAAQMGTSGEEGEGQWAESRRSLEKRLAEEKELRERLRRSPLDRERMSSSMNNPTLHRTSSTQSLPANSCNDHTHSPYDRARLSPTSSLHNYSVSSRSKATQPTLLGKGSLTGSSSLNHSLSSLTGSHISTQSTRDHTHRLPSRYLTEQHARSHHQWSRELLNPHSVKGGPSDGKSQGGTSNGMVTFTLTPHPYSSRSRQPSASSSRASSVQGSPPQESLSNGRSGSSDVELERAKLKIKTLEREVTLLEKLLGDKARSSQRHVEELMSLRTQLAQEKASLAIVRQEARDEVDRKMGVAQSTHIRQTGEFDAQLQKMEEGRKKVEKQKDSLKHELLGKERESSRLQTEVLTLKREMKEEKASRTKMVASLQAELQDSSAQVAHLENRLRAKKAELEGVVSRSEMEATHYKADMMQTKKKMDSISTELKERIAELVKSNEAKASLSHDLDSVKAEFQKSRTSWDYSEKALTGRLRECESARDSLLHQLAQAKQKMSHQSSRSRKEEEEIAAELARYRGEVQQLVGAVKNEKMLRSLAEGEVDQLKEEIAKLKREAEEAGLRLQEGERKWMLDRERVKECEMEGRSLREEVGRLSEDLRTCRRRLQEEMEQKAEKEREGEEALSRLQQELNKRAQKVLEMDRLLQTHQTDTTARRLQLERGLTRMEGEVKGRTREVETLTTQAAEDRATIKDLREQLEQFKENQRNLFSGSQAQIINKDSRLAELEAQVKKAESALREREEEISRVQVKLEQTEQTRLEEELGRKEVESQLQSVSEDNRTMRAAHQTEVERLVQLHACQLSSREEQVSTGKEQLQQLTIQDKARQQELSRYRAQVTSLSAELSAERRVAEDAQRDALQAKMEVEQWRTQVADLKALASQHDQTHQIVPATHLAPPTSNTWELANHSRTTPTSSATPTLPALSASDSGPSVHLNGTEGSSATPPSTVTTPIPKGSIFNV